MTNYAPHKDIHRNLTPEPAPDAIFTPAEHVHTKDCWMLGDPKCIAWRINRLEAENNHIVEKLGRIRQTLREIKGVLDKMDGVIERELKK